MMASEFAGCPHGGSLVSCVACLDAYMVEDLALADIEEATGLVGALTVDEREALAVFADGSYSCACPDRCPELPCANDRDDVFTVVERILAGRFEALASASHEAEMRWLLGEWLTGGPA